MVVLHGRAVVVQHRQPVRDADEVVVVDPLVLEVVDDLCARERVQGCGSWQRAQEGYPAAQNLAHSSALRPATLPIPGGIS